MQANPPVPPPLNWAQRVNSTVGKAAERADPPLALPGEVGLALARWAGTVVGEEFKGFDLDTLGVPGGKINEKVTGGISAAGEVVEEAWGGARRLFAFLQPGNGRAALEEEVLGRIGKALGEGAVDYVVVVRRGLRGTDLLTPQQAVEAERAFGFRESGFGKLLAHPALRASLTIRKRIGLFEVREGVRGVAQLAVPLSVFVFVPGETQRVRHIYGEVHMDTREIREITASADVRVEGRFVVNGTHAAVGKVLDVLRDRGVDTMRGLSAHNDLQVRFAAGESVATLVAGMRGVSVVGLGQYRMGEGDLLVALAGDQVEVVPGMVGIGRWIPAGKGRIWAVVGKEDWPRIQEALGKVRDGVGGGQRVGNLRGWLADGRPALRRELAPVVADVVIHGVPLWFSLGEVKAKLGVGKGDSRRFFVAANGDAFTFDVDVVGVVGEEERARWLAVMVGLDPRVRVSARAGVEEEVEWDW